MSGQTEEDFYSVMKIAFWDAGISFVPTEMLHTIVGIVKSKNWFIHDGKFIEPIDVDWDGSDSDNPKYDVWVEPDYNWEDE